MLDAKHHTIHARNAGAMNRRCCVGVTIEYVCAFVFIVASFSIKATVILKIKLRLSLASVSCTITYLGTFTAMTY